MLKRTTKTPFGEVDRICTDSQFPNGKETIYDSVYPGMYGYNPEGLSVNYEIEYLTIPEEEWKGDADAWEHFNTFETDSLGNAVREFCIRMLDDETIDLNFFMQISRNGNEVAEIYMDIPYDLPWYLRNMVDAQINRRLSERENKISELSKELELYKAFVEKYHVTEMFRGFKEGKANG